MIITAKNGDTLASLAAEYSVPADKLGADNGLSEEREPVAGQSIVVAVAESSYVPQEKTTVADISQITQTSQKNIFRNNFFLGGQQNVDRYSFVVLSYEEATDIKKIIGGYAYDFISESLLHRVINYLTYVMPFTYGFNAEGEMIEPKDDYILKAASDNGVNALMHVSTLTEQGVFDSELPGQVFENDNASERLTNNIINIASEKKYGGVDVDFEFLPVERKDEYVSFLTRLSKRLHEIGKILVVALPPKISDDQPGRLYEGIDYGEIGTVADYVLVMSYEPPIGSYTATKIKVKEKQKTLGSLWRERKRCERKQVG